MEAEFILILSNLVLLSFPLLLFIPIILCLISQYHFVFDSSFFNVLLKMVFLLLLRQHVKILRFGCFGILILTEVTSLMPVSNLKNFHLLKALYYFFICYSILLCAIDESSFFSLLVYWLKFTFDNFDAIIYIYSKLIPK